MPELPEVETIRRDLQKTLVNEVIAKVKVLGATSVKPEPKQFTKILKDLKITSVERRAKLLIFNFDKEDCHMLVHLKMTGQFMHVGDDKVLSGAYALSKIKKGLAFESEDNSKLRHKARELPDSWTRVQFDFESGSQLFFNDIRRFGYLAIVDSASKQKTLDNYGIEPFKKDFTLENFQKVFKGRKTLLKALLLNQKLIAGLGNIYVDELCFYAGVRPGKRVNRVTRKQIELLHEGCELILKKALDNRGTSFSDYRDASGEKGNNQSFLKVYGREGEKCTQCSALIVKIKLTGRGSSYCPKCQQ
jgi:formamidopyrimidine-DNA glycosylase